MVNGAAPTDGSRGRSQPTAAPPATRSIPVEERPVDHTPVHTNDLPDTPQRDSAIEAGSWAEAPAELIGLGNDIGGAAARYLRRIGPWLLWRSGPPRGGDARYWVADARDLARQHTFHLSPNGTGSGIGPSGEQHARFRTWKEDLRDHPDP